jgi:transcriptional regulator with XRE-family HTH domain
VERQEIYADFGRLVAERRKRQKLTQEAFAVALGMSRASVANIERGKQPVQLHLIYKIASILNADVSEFIPAATPGILQSLQLSEWLTKIKGSNSLPSPRT